MSKLMDVILESVPKTWNSAGYIINSDCTLLLWLHYRSPLGFPLKSEISSC